jgi:Fur family ferric uptake transcriptional regulator
MDKAIEILKASGLHITASRLAVLNVFLKTSRVVNHTELMDLCKKTVNRITLYRTLQSFYQHRLLVKIPSTNGIPRYVYKGIPSDDPVSKKHDLPGRQAHLVCQNCGKIISLEHFRLPRIDLPKDFEADFMDLIVNGKCTSCSKE